MQALQQALQQAIQAMQVDPQEVQGRREREAREESRGRIGCGG